MRAAAYLCPWDVTATGRPGPHRPLAGVKFQFAAGRPVTREGCPS